ncbi:MAG: HD domain-containing protein [Elusimicrobiota bacterium]
MLVKPKSIFENKEVRIYITKADKNFRAMGYKEHGLRHSRYVAKTAALLLHKLGYHGRELELVRIAGYLHDIGCVVGDNKHDRSGGVIALRILLKLGMDKLEAFRIAEAVGTHEDARVVPPTPIAAAVVLCDKTDVHYSRLRKKVKSKFDQHDRVNFASSKSKLEVQRKKMEIVLKLGIDNSKCSVIEYFGLFLPRIKHCQRAAKRLGCRFSVFINSQRFL